MKSEEIFKRIKKLVPIVPPKYRERPYGPYNSLYSIGYNIARKEILEILEEALVDLKKLDEYENLISVKETKLSELSDKVAKLGKELKRSPTVVERFLDNIKKNDTNGCWEWLGAKDTYDYGVLTSKFLKERRAHRVAYTLFIGPIPEGSFVCHRCDNPSCCNPEHLFVGTAYDNTEDARSKGRVDHKLNEEQVKEIKRLLKIKIVGQRDIARNFKISRSTVSRINTGELWSHVTIDDKE